MMKRINYTAARLVSISAYALLVFIFCAIMIGQLEKNIESSGFTLKEAKENSQLLEEIYQIHRELDFSFKGNLFTQKEALLNADKVCVKIVDILQNLKNNRAAEINQLRQAYHSLRSIIWGLLVEYDENPYSEEAEEFKEKVSEWTKRIMDQYIGIMNIGNEILTQANEDSNNLFVSLRSYMVNFCIFIGVILVASAIYLNRLLRRPVRELAKAADEIRSGNLEYTLDVRDIPRDELGMLMRNFNVMARRLSHTAGRLEEANKNLKQEADVMTYLAEQKTKFIRHLGHELRAPLSSIIGFTELLIEGYYGDLTSKQEDYLGRINKSGNHLLALVNDLVDQAKLQAGTLRLNYEEFEFVKFVNEIFGSFEQKARKEGITMVFEQGSVKDDQKIQFDGKRISQALINLISNALKFTPDGESVSVNLEVKGNMARVRVKDTGIGIKDDEIDEIFTEFHQGDTVKSSEGAGLGLPLSRQLVILHQGDITVDSKLGEGACFTMTLPIKKPEEQAVISES